MNTYFEGGFNMEWFRDYRHFSERVGSPWINLCKQNIFDNKVYKTSDLFYSEFQCEVVLFLEDLERKDIVLFFDLMTKSKINHIMKIIQNDQQSLNLNSLNYSFTANFDQTIFSSTQLSMNYETEIFFRGIISITLTLTVMCAFILIPLAIYLVCHYRQ